MFVYTLLLSLFFLHISAEKCVTPNKEEAECISLYSCPSLLSALGSLDPISLQFVQNSSSGCTAAYPMVCCGRSSNFTVPEEKKPTETKNVDKMSLLPSKKYCGLQHSDDYFRDENLTVARINEFPWLAGIFMIDKRDKEGIGGIGCAGSLINKRYVLTAAICLVSGRGKPVAVHLGEYDTHLEKDCVQEPPFEEECSEPLQVFGIEKIIIHPDFRRSKLKNDIALIRLNRSVGYNDYVRPVCLPFPGTPMAQVGDVLRSSGWGYMNFEGIPASVKKRILTKLIDSQNCNSYYGRITDNHICVVHLNNASDFSCQGDGGAPLIFSKRVQWHQEGINSADNCGTTVPDVYTKVVNYLNWILENIEE